VEGSRAVGDQKKIIPRKKENLRRKKGEVTKRGVSLAVGEKIPKIYIGKCETKELTKGKRIKEWQ